MTTIKPCEVPPDSLLRKYKDDKGYADCYVIEVAGRVSQAVFIEAFYTSPLFKVERTILKHLASKPSTDGEARQLANGSADRFAAWRVEGQSASELLLADFTGRTRSWLMASPVGGGTEAVATRLHFGSAVVSRPHRGGRKAGMGWLFIALLGFHRLYSRLLLRVAGKRARPAY